MQIGVAHNQQQFLRTVYHKRSKFELSIASSLTREQDCTGCDGGGSTREDDNVEEDGGVIYCDDNCDEELDDYCVVEQESAIIEARGPLKILDDIIVFSDVN